MRPALLPVLLALMLRTACAAGDLPWQASGPGGQTYELTPADGQPAAPWRIQRRLPDGSVDTRYGERGGAAVSLGPDHDEPAVLRVDAQGRAWVAGASQEVDGQRGVVLRFAPTGLPDRRFGQNGRSSVAPAEHEVRVLDLLPLDDGSVLVAGMVVDTGDNERPAVWRLRDDGNLDARFAGKGLWMDAGRGEAELAGLHQSPDGGYALGVRRPGEARAQLETWSWSEGGTPRREAVVEVPLQNAGTLRLGWRDGAWTWADPSAAATPVAAAPAADATRDAPVAAIATPFSDRSAASAVAPRPAEDGQAASAGWWLLLPAGVWAMWWWRRRGAAGA